MKKSEASIVIDVPFQKVPSKKVSVFYNPVMKLNRDICVLLISSLKKKVSVADPLAGSGIRSLRLLKECKNIKKVFANDISPSAVSSIKKNAELNNLKLDVSNKDASVFLLESNGFDYIDIDPFGSPNRFLDAAVKRISRGGILAVTATDTSALSGTYLFACLRKYWAVPLRNFLMHEVGLRILIRKIQLVGAQFDKAFIPVFCHSSNHYMRVYLQCKKGKANVNKMLSKHLFLHFNKKNFSITLNKFNSASKDVLVAGPLWSGLLWDSSLIKKMLSKAEGEAKQLLEVIYEESLIGSVGFFDYYEICSKLKCSVPKQKTLINAVKKSGFKASPTHFSSQSLRSNISSTALLELISNLCSH